MRLAFGGLRRLPPSGDQLKVRAADPLRSLIADPGKLLPLLTGVWWVAPIPATLAISTSLKAGEVEKVLAAKTY